MTAEEMEVSYCKARITCMRSFVRWLREHVKTAEDAKTLGVSDETNLSLTLGAMRKADEEITKELDNIMLISEKERKEPNDFGESRAAEVHRLTE